jgi:hypothetical protein
LVAVFPTDAAARSAIEVLKRAGIETDFETRSDEVAALRGEMYEEMQHTIVGPGNVGRFTKEMTRGILGGTLAATLLGALLGLPLGAIRYGNLGLGERMLIAAAVGAFLGAGVGFVAGGAFSWRASVGGAAVTKQLAAERGVTVGVWATDDDEAESAAAILTAAHPIRVDRITAEGHALRTVTTEENRPE